MESTLRLVAYARVPKEHTSAVESLLQRSLEEIAAEGVRVRSDALRVMSVTHANKDMILAAADVPTAIALKMKEKLEKVIAQILAFSGETSEGDVYLPRSDAFVGNAPALQLQ